MNLKQLEAFVCVAEVKSFSQAAKKLYLTQPRSEERRVGKEC